MKSFLAFLVAMGSIVTLGDAHCEYILQSPSRPYKGCMLNGKLYPFGHIERTEDCLKCNCGKFVMGCCSLYFTFKTYDTENCKVIFNKKRCNYELVQKDDPSKECATGHAESVG